jgi:hypothetical protein
MNVGCFENLSGTSVSKSTEDSFVVCLYMTILVTSP